MVVTSPVLHLGQKTFPTSGSSPWRDTLAAGNLDSADNSGNSIIDPATLAADGRLVFRRVDGNGTNVRARMRYDDGITAITTDVVVVLFGRFSSEGVDFWQPLRNKDGDFEVTVAAVVASDVEDGTDAYTTPGITTHTWDTDGCDEFFWGVKTAFLATGDETTAAMQSKFL
jgi:hypothetical protein